jgi:Ca-activated chloride channel homolog
MSYSHEYIPQYNGVIKMKRMIHLGFLVIVTFLLVQVLANADGIILPDHPENGWLTITYHRVSVKIEDGIVITRVDQEFRNDTPFMIEGRYIFPLPHNAFVSEFSMWTDGARLEGKILTSQEARDIYEDYVQRILDPALLEYIGRDTMAARIFPIAPGGTRRIELSYTEVLQAQDGVYRYVYPLDTERFSAYPLEEVLIGVDIKTEVSLQAVYSPTHKITTTKDTPNRAYVHYAEQDVLPQRDFILYYSVLPEEMGITLLTYGTQGNDGFFLLIVSPNVEESNAAIAKDLVFVLDTSGSMSGEKIVQAKEALNFVLHNLNPEDRFAVVSFSDYPRAHSNKLLAVSQETRTDVTDWVSRLIASGGTNIDEALVTALSLFEDNESPHYVIFLTDGQPTVGKTDPLSIITDTYRANTAHARIFSFGVGYDVNTLLLDRLSQENHGTTVYVTPDENLEIAISSFYQKIAAPVLTSPEISIEGVNTYDRYPQPLPDVFRGSQVLFTGRYQTGGEAKITLSGDVRGEEVYYIAQRLFPEVALDADFLPRVWAGRKIAYLLDQLRLYGETKEIVDEVIELSKRYGIITPYTSFLVEEGPLSADQMASRMTQAASAPPSGKQAVAGASSLRDLAEDEAAPPEEETVRIIDNRTFFLKNGTWTESTYIDEETVKIAAFSSAYFDVLLMRPELGAFFALGDQVIVKVGKCYLEIGPQGQEELTEDIIKQISQ